jgi:hypothetical protein
VTQCPHCPCALLALHWLAGLLMAKLCP